MVLDQGVAREFGSPLELVKSGGIFAEMVSQSGHSQALIEIAKEGWKTELIESSGINQNDLIDEVNH